MYNLRAYAYRKEGLIYVTIIGDLPNSCYKAKVTDKYPGGTIFYLIDPCAAQVFITQTQKPNSEICTMNLIPWVEHISIVDSEHKEVDIYINNELKLKINIEEAPQEYIVIALTSTLNEGYCGCSIIPKNSCFSAIYSKVYGPDSKKSCQKWIKKNCKLKNK